MSAQPQAGPEPATNRSKTTVLTLLDKRRRGQPISMLTAYDFPTARLADEAGLDALLVGDSLAMVVLGHPNTLSVTMDEMLHHARAVSRGARHALLIGDLPFMSYQAGVGEALHNAARFVKEAGMDAVKLEGGREYAETVRALVRAGIPVQGHVGLQPQSVNVLGGFRVQGRSAVSAEAILADAVALQEAGCFSIVLESVPQRLATHITAALEIPTIGIGAGPGTSGQVLVTHDLVGLYHGTAPKFAKRYVDLGTAWRDAMRAYREDVEAGRFPQREHAYAMPEDEWQAFLERVRAQPAAPNPSASRVLRARSARG